MSSPASSAAAVRAASAPVKGNRLSPLQLALLVNAIFAGFCLLPRVRDSRPLLLSIASVALGLAAFSAIVPPRLGEPLNLMVRRLDWLNDGLERFAARLRMPRPGWSSRQLNFAHMGVWIALFSVMTASGFVGHKHPGQDPEFWHKACDGHRGNACAVWVRTLHVGCDANMAGGCWLLGQALAQGVATTRDPAEAGKSVARACDLGLAEACGGLQAYAGTEVGRTTLERSCERGDGASCFIAGSLYHLGKGVAADDRRAFDLFGKSCAVGWPRGCARLGESYTFGEGVARDPARGLSLFEKACDRQYGPACVNAAVMYHRGDAVPKDLAKSRQMFRAACSLGIQEACKWAESPSI